MLASCIRLELQTSSLDGNDSVLGYENPGVWKTAILWLAKCKFGWGQVYSHLYRGYMYLPPPMCSIQLFASCHSPARFEDEGRNCGGVAEIVNSDLKYYDIKSAYKPTTCESTRSSVT